MSFTYLASPYSPVGEHSPEEKIRLRQVRYEQVCAKAAELMLKHELIFCPIAHSHPIELQMDSVKDGDFWLLQDFAILAAASKVKVYRMEGWDKSYGVRKEIEFAEARGIPVEYID
jgi:hypothetical protein